MSLRILVIGRGNDPTTTVINGHQLTFVENAWDGGSVDAITGRPTSYLDIRDFDFVIQHLSAANPEGPDAISHWKTLDLPASLLGVSGGQVRQLPVIYASTGIPCIENSVGCAGIVALSWGRVPADFTGDADELHLLLTTKDPSTNILFALSILSQGYLVVSANQGQGTECQDFLKPWASESDPDYSSRIPQIQSNKFWGVFDEKEKAELVLLAKEEGFARAAPLMTAVVEGRNVDKSIDPRMVVDAYATLAERLGAMSAV